MTPATEIAFPLHKIAELCRRYHVRELAVFGSAARRDLRPDSDIDLLVEFDPDALVGLIDHAGLMLDLTTDHYCFGHRKCIITVRVKQCWSGVL